VTEEAVRPCLRCDTLVEESRAYCPACGSYLASVRLVVSRPAAIHRGEGALVAGSFSGALAACFVFSALAVALAAFASFP
jgi:hypothetical protein